MVSSIWPPSARQGRAHDERIEAAPDVAFPVWRGRDVGLHGGVTVALCDLRVAAYEEFHRAVARPSSSWLREHLTDGHFDENRLRD